MGSPPLHRLSATEAARGVREGRWTAVDLLEDCLARIGRWEPVLHAWAHLAPDTARAAARAVDRLVRTGYPVGALGGVPVGVKDIFNTADMPTAMGSPLWEGFTPGNDARVVAQIRLAGGVVPGKTVTAEFAVHTPGPTANPHNPAYMPGTSSSGSAAAVAASMVPLALGSQTAGSIVRPASYCGVYGFKPSFGWIPRTGSLKTTDSLDSIGLFARCLDDVFLFFDVIRVDGPDYPFSHQALNDPARQKKADGPWRVAVFRGPKWGHAESYAQDALLRLAEKVGRLPNVTVEEAEGPASLSEVHELHARIYDKALSNYFQVEFQEGRKMSRCLQDMIRHGQTISPTDYKAALRRQADIARDTDRWLEERYDAVLALSTGGEPLKGLDADDRPDSALIWTFCGLPALSVPAFAGPTGLPFGLQLVARRYNDRPLLHFARLLETHGLAPRDTFPALKPIEAGRREGGS